MTAISREQLILLAETAMRRALRPDERDTLADGLTATWDSIDSLERRANDYARTILSQRRELINAQKAS